MTLCSVGTKPISNWWRSSHGHRYHGDTVVMVVMVLGVHVTILHHYLAPLPPLLMPVALLLLLLDPIPLVLTPGVVGWRTPIDQLVQQAVLSSATVLPRPEHREVRLQGLQQLVNYITACLGTLISEWIMMTSMPTAMVMMTTSMMMVSVSTMRPGTRSPVSKNSIVQ